MDQSIVLHATSDGARTGSLNRRHFGVRFIENAATSIGGWWGFCLLIAGLQALTHRNSMNPDGLSYVDMASEAMIGGPSKLLNTYWSPGYSALISMGWLAVRPSPSQEFPLVHFINFLIFGLALGAFTFFFLSWLAMPHDSDITAEQRKKWLVPVGFGMFLFFTVKFIGLDMVTPDLAFAAVVLLAAGLCCKVQAGATWKHYAALGCSLGLGYYMKAAMCPLALMLFLILFIWPPSKISRPKLLAAVVAFGVVAAPLVVFTSSRAGYLTIGESGRLNYIWYVSDRELASFPGWKGHFGDFYATLFHPPRTVLRKPLTVEFATPVSGTNPLWYEPSYWWGREAIRFSMRRQLMALADNVRSLVIALFQMAAYVAGAIMMLGFSVHRKTRIMAFRNANWRLAWPVLVCSAYAFIHVETRFIAPFVLLFWLSIYSILMFRVPTRARKAILVPVLSLAMLSVTAVSLADARTLRDRGVVRQPDYQIVGEVLRNAGVGKGDDLAVLGNSFDPYYARYAGARVVAQIPDADEFWSLSRSEQGAVADRLAAIGVKAIVARSGTDGAPRPGWRDVNVGNSARFHILLLSDPLSQSK